MAEGEVGIGEARRSAGWAEGPDGRMDRPDDRHRAAAGAAGALRIRRIGQEAGVLRIRWIGQEAGALHLRRIGREAGDLPLRRIGRYGRRRGLSGRFAGVPADGGLFGNTVKTMLFSVLILLFNMATGVLTARLLGPEGRGIQTALVLWPQFFAYTTTLGIHSALAFYMKKEPEREKALVAAGLLMTLLTGAGAIAVGSLVIPFRLSGYPEWVTAAGVSLMAAVPFVHLFFLSHAILRARNQFRLFNRTRCLVPMTTLAMLAGLAATGRLTPLAAAVSYQLAYVPIALWAAAKDIRSFSAGWKAIGEAAGKLYRYGIRSYGVDLLGNLTLYIDQILLVGLLAPEALGLYAAAVSLSRVLNVFSSSIAVVLFPQASALPEAEAAKLSLRAFKISLLSGLAAALAMAALAPVLLHLLYGSAFAAAIPAFRLLALEVAVGGAALVLGQAFMAVGKPGVMSLSLGLNLLVLTALIIVLVPRYGVIGAGWSLLAASGVRLIYISVRFAIRFRCGFRAMLPDKADFARLAEALKNRRAVPQTAGRRASGGASPSEIGT